jgi:hypothetical protein
MLADGPKLVFILILTHPNMELVGAMKATAEGLAIDINWGRARMLKTLRGLADSGMILFSEHDGVVFLPHYILHNPPDNPNQVTGLLRGVQKLPECELQARVVESVLALRPRMHGTFLAAFKKVEPALQDIARKTEPLGNGSQTVSKRSGKPSRNYKTKHKHKGDKNSLDFTYRTKEDSSPDFLAFWEAYPRQVYFPAAGRAWATLEKEGVLPPLDDILEGISHWQGSHGWRDSQFIPYPSKFLRERAWESRPTTRKTRGAVAPKSTPERRGKIAQVGRKV